MSNPRQLFVPYFLQAELERLANSLNIDFSIGDDSGEAEYLHLLDKIVTTVESTKSEVEQLKEVRQTENSNNHKTRRGDQLSAEEKKLLKQTEAFEANISKSIVKADEGLGYQEKINRMNQKFLKERDQRKVLETYIQAQDKKVKVLVDHVEKLMKAIKIESNKRLQVVEENRRIVREQTSVQLQAEKQQRVNATQHKAIVELTEGSKVLEDQLRLMDEKYLDLKNKFDMAREQFHRKLTAALKHNDELQIQMRMSGSFHRPPPTMMMTTMSGIPQSQSFGSRPISPTAQQHQQQQQQRPMSPSMQRSNSIIATNVSNNSSSHEIAVGSGMNQALLAKKSAATAAVSNVRKVVSPDNHLDHNPNAVSPSSSAWRRQSMPMMDTTGGEKQQQIPTFNTEYFEPLDPRMQQQLQMPPITTSTSTQRPFSAQHHHHQQQFAPQDDSFYFAQQQQRQSRPNTTGRHHRHRHQSSAGLHSQKNLNRVLTKITHHSGKKVQWSAERLSDLLDSCGD